MSPAFAQLPWRPESDPEHPTSQAGCHIPIIPALKKLRHKDQELKVVLRDKFKAILKIMRPCLKGGKSFRQQKPELPTLNLTLPPWMA